MTLINAVHYTETWNSPVYKQLGFTHRLTFKFSLLVVSVNTFHNPLFCFFLLDKQHPVGLKKLPMLFKFFLFPKIFSVLVYTHVRCGCGCRLFTRTLFCFPSWWIELSSEWIEHLWMDAWPYFPGIKVGNNVSVLPFWLFGWRWL